MECWLSIGYRNPPDARRRKGHRRCGQTNAESIHDMGKVLLVFMDPTRLENGSVTVRSAFKDSLFGKVVAVWRGVGRVQPAIAAVPFIVGPKNSIRPADKGMRPFSRWRSSLARAQSSV